MLSVIMKFVPVFLFCLRICQCFFGIDNQHVAQTFKTVYVYNAEQVKSKTGDPLTVTPKEGLAGASSIW